MASGTLATEPSSCLRVGGVPQTTTFAADEYAGFMGRTEHLYRLLMWSVLVEASTVEPGEHDHQSDRRTGNREGAENGAWPGPSRYNLHTEKKKVVPNEL